MSHQHTEGLRFAVFVTHADVLIDPAVPVERWRLSPRGAERHRAFNGHPAIRHVRAVWSSMEQKAVDGAAILASHLGLAPRTLHALHENDRTATGYLPPAEFEATADAFFAHPQESVRGWERAVDAQARIVAAVREIAAEALEGDVAIVAHGGVGALLLAARLGQPISRAWDQPGRGGGNWFRFAIGAADPAAPYWRPIDAGFSPPASAPAIPAAAAPSPG